MGGEEKPRVLITSLIPEECMREALRILCEQFEVESNPYGRVLSEEELILHLHDVDAVFAGGDPFTAKVFSSTEKLKVLVKEGVGLDSVDVQAATEKGVLVAISPLVCESVADLTFGLILCVSRRILEGDRLVRSGRWAEKNEVIAHEVHGKTLGIIGLGRIGSMVAKRANAFNMRVLAFDPYVSQEKALEKGAELVPLSTLLEKSDIITIHTPLTDETRGMISEREFRLMKEGVYLVNTARGAVVDEAALVKALEEGRVAGAGLDVLTVEPPTADNPLLSFDNVVFTPHVGNDTVETLRELALQAARDIIMVLEGGMPSYPVNPEALKKRAEFTP